MADAAASGRHSCMPPFSLTFSSGLTNVSSNGTNPKSHQKHLRRRPSSSRLCRVSSRDSYRRSRRTRRLRSTHEYSTKPPPRRRACSVEHSSRMIRKGTVSHEPVTIESASSSSSAQMSLSLSSPKRSRRQRWSSNSGRWSPWTISTSLSIL